MNYTTFLRHEAESIRNKDARVRGPRILEAVVKWADTGKLAKGFTFDECISYCEAQFDWATTTHRPATAAVYRKVISDLWPHKGDSK